MKYNMFYLASVGLVVSCSIQEENYEVSQVDDVVFFASFEQPTYEETKVYANEDLFLRWTADDRVSIFEKNTYNQQFRFTGETGDNAGGFKKVGSDDYYTGNSIPSVVSVYPYLETTKISESGVLTVDLPAEQYYAENTFGLGSNTMVSVTEDSFLQYKNVGGYLILKLYGDGDGVSVSSITLKGNNGEKIAGKANVTMPLNGVPSATLANDATSEITLTCAAPVQLGVDAENSTQFWFVVPSVTFSKGFTITIKDDMGHEFIKTTTSSLQINRNMLKRMSPFKAAYSEMEDAVDLGLSVRWASCNLGASSPEEYGGYYAWAEIEPYYEMGYSQENPQTHWKSGKESGYDWKWSNYSWHDNTQLTKYCLSTDEGSVDGKTVLELTEDAANASMHGLWRIPTDSEWAELRENCTWEWTTNCGINGYRVSGNGQSIFLPASGYRDGTNLLSLGTNGLYWSSSLCQSNSLYAWDVYFNSSKVSRDDFDRYYGLTIRPVYGEYVLASDLFLSSSSLDLVEGETAQLNAILSPKNCLEKNILWTSSDLSIVEVSDEGFVTAMSCGTATVTAFWAGNDIVRSECIVTVAQNTIIAFEDPAFKAFCINNYDSDQDGEVCFDEADDVTSMVVCTDDIMSLVGIEHFVSLESLTCSGTTHDSEFGGSGKLSAIDLSHNTQLTYLDCSANQLQELDLTHNQALSTVMCTGNPLLVIDISKNPSIETLYAEEMDRLVVIFVPDSFDESSHPAYHKEPTAIYLEKNPSVDEFIIDDGFGQRLNIKEGTEYTVCFNGKCYITAYDSSDGGYVTVDLYANETDQTIMGEIVFATNNRLYGIIQKPIRLYNDAIYYRSSSSVTSTSDRIKNPSNCFDITGQKLTIVSKRIVPGNRCKIQYSGEVYAIGADAFSVTAIGDGSNTQTMMSCIWLPYSVKEIRERSFYNYRGNSLLWQLCGFDRVDKVASYSFYGLQTQLSEYTFNCKMTEIPSGLFGLSIAQTIIIPEGVTKIGGSAFGHEHFSVNTIVLPSTLAEIGYDAFGDTKPFEIFAYMITPPNYSNWKYTHTQGTKLHVPEGCGANYTQWTQQVNKWTVIDDL